MTEALLVACHSCGRSFASPLQPDRRGYERAPLDERRYACPLCGAESTYQREDHYYGSMGHSPGAVGGLAEAPGGEESEDGEPGD